MKGEERKTKLGGRNGQRRGRKEGRNPDPFQEPGVIGRPKSYCFGKIAPAASAEAHRRRRGFFRSAQALLPPHECGGSLQNAIARRLNCGSPENGATWSEPPASESVWQHVFFVRERPRSRANDPQNQRELSFRRCGMLFVVLVPTLTLRNAVAERRATGA